MRLPSDLERGAPSGPAPRGRRSAQATAGLLGWALRWVAFIVERVHPDRGREAAQLLAAASLSHAEALEAQGAALPDRAEAWLTAIRGGHLADLRGLEVGGWAAGAGKQIPADSPL